jgi:hypothetical protein
LFSGKESFSIERHESENDTDKSPSDHRTSETHSSRIVADPQWPIDDLYDGDVDEDLGPLSSVGFSSDMCFDTPVKCSPKNRSESKQKVNTNSFTSVDENEPNRERGYSDEGIGEYDYDIDEASGDSDTSSSSELDDRTADNNSDMIMAGGAGNDSNPPTILPGNGLGEVIEQTTKEKVLDPAVIESRRKDAIKMSGLLKNWGVSSKTPPEIKPSTRRRVENVNSPAENMEKHR